MKGFQKTLGMTRNEGILKGLHRELAIGGVSEEFGP